MMNGLPWAWAMSAAARMLARLTGWPPPALLVTVIMTHGTCSAFSAMNASSRPRSMLPLKSDRSSGSRPSGTTRSTASAPVASMLPRVVSKWVLDGTLRPGPPRIENRIASAARPWWVGMMWAKSASSRTAASKRWNDGDPA